MKNIFALDTESFILTRTDGILYKQPFRPTDQNIRLCSSDVFIGLALLSRNEFLQVWK